MRSRSAHYVEFYLRVDLMFAENLVAVLLRGLAGHAVTGPVSFAVSTDREHKVPRARRRRDHTNDQYS
jgi:hypothetical protein